MGLPWRILVTAGILRSKFQHFRLFRQKCLLDKMTGIHYLNLSRRLPLRVCCLIFGALT